MPNKHPAHTTGHSSQPLLSILVPVYNEETTIKEILRKVTSLPIKSYEVLVVDDDSKDSSRAIIEEFNQKFSKSNLKYFLMIKIVVKELG